MNINIELTQQEHQDLIELLNDMSGLRYDQVIALGQVPEAEERYQYCLRQARAATRLMMKLARC